MQTWTKSIEKFIATLPVVEFPLGQSSQIFSAERTVLRLADSARLQPYLWCYLERTVRKGFTEFNPLSLSSARVTSLPKVIERLSKWYRFEETRPRTIESDFGYLSQFVSWADTAENQGKFIDIFADADLALLALKGYHTYLRQLLQAHQITHATAAHRDQRPIKVMSEIHGRSYKDDIEPLSAHGTGSTEAPLDEEAAKFMSTLQAIFDSSTRLILRNDELSGTAGGEQRAIRLSQTDDSLITTLPANYSEARLMELACVAFAGIAIGDSGANLAQMQAYEEPEDLLVQLAQPERINLTQKVVKFRAGGREVPVHLTATTLSRMRSYLETRSRLIATLKCNDIAQFFVQCEYGGIVSRVTPREPISVVALHKEFLTHIRRKVILVGAELPAINLRQLRAYKQQYLARHHGLKVAADVMGHSMATAIASYCKTQESVRQSELGKFLESLTSTILDPARGSPGESPTVDIPAGACAQHGKPTAIEIKPVVVPNCSNTEGCFFCAQYRVHADEHDLRKLLSCRYVLHRLAPPHGESASADRIYCAVIDRIDILLSGIRLRIPQEYEKVAADVQDAGNLSRYWSVKLQQLHLLGMLTPIK